MQVQLRAFPTTRHAAIFVAGAHTETAPVARGIYCSAHDTSAYSRGSPPARGAVLLFVSLQTGTTGERFCSPSCTSTTAPGTFRASPALCGVTGPEHTVLSRHVVGKKQKSPPRRTPWQRLHRHTPPPIAQRRARSAKVQAPIHQRTCASTGTRMPPSPPAGNLPQAPG